MPDELEERLKSHARAFDSLLSLIPAKLYYGEDVSDQWKRKKQTPEQKRAAKMAKLDPDNWKSAKDVMDERAAAAVKRKRDEDGEIVIPTEDTEKPRAMQDQEIRKTKKRKMKNTDGGDIVNESKPHQENVDDTAEEQKRHKVAQKAAKRERRQARQMKAKQKKEKSKQKKTESRGSPSGKRHDKSHIDDNENDSEDGEQDEQVLAEPIDLGIGTTHERHARTDAVSSDAEMGESGVEDLAEEIDMDHTNAEKIVNEEVDTSSTASSSGDIDSQILSPQPHSASSSISSIQLVSAEPPSKSLKIRSSGLQPSPPPENQKSSEPSAEQGTQTPKERLEARLSLLRAERKADEKPARNRQELLEQRRRKEEERKAAKKEQRRKEKEEEARQQDEEIARRFSPGGSGSLLASPRSPMMDSGNNFTFGRVAFSDGTQADASLTNLQEQRKPKGPRDPASALKAAQNKSSRLSGLDEDKREKISQQDMWLSAKKRAHGEKVRDDQSLLKKALKRKESDKRKSETEWQKREEGVRYGQEKRQQKRQDNLQKRRDEKGGGSGAAKGKSGQKVKRPGFEGSFRGRTGGGKKK